MKSANEKSALERLRRRHRKGATAGGWLMRQARSAEHCSASPQLPVLKFRHEYYKLKEAQFTTIRGAAQFKKFQVGQDVKIETPSETFDARIVGLELLRLGDIRLWYLKRDAEFPGFKIYGKQDFVNLLNGFRAPFWTRVTVDSQVTVFHLIRSGEAEA